MINLIKPVEAFEYR